MDFKTRTLAELRATDTAKTLATRRVLVGFDGFVDTIVSPVALRAGQGDNFTPVRTIEEFGQRILGASGKSTNIELFPTMEKLGGNGPIMANALLAHDLALTYIGALGAPNTHPVFSSITERAKAVFSLCQAGATTAVEFTDGKLLLGQMRSLDEVTPARIRETIGEERYLAALTESDLIAVLNWVMIPNLTEVFVDLVDNVLPKIPRNHTRADGTEAERIYFFDLCDPEKRSPSDLAYALDTIGRFSDFGSVTLGLNLKEAQQVYAVLGFGVETESESGLRNMAARIREKLGLATVVVHPKESAACATRDGTHWVPGPFVAEPFISTGAGDHFNAGFATGQLLGLSPEACLAVGVCTSGHYVRTAHSPTIADIETLLSTWR